MESSRAKSLVVFFWWMNFKPFFFFFCLPHQLRACSLGKFEDKSIAKANTIT
jgi:hypothetical protein